MFFKRLSLILISILVVSCSGLARYSKVEFEKKYIEAESLFSETLEEEIGKKKLAKLEKTFTSLKKQLNENNENYYRIEEELVIKYNKEINHYLSLINDLKD